MSITTAQIHGAITHGGRRSILIKLNAGTASVVDINASLIELEEKKSMLDVKNGTATRASINGRLLDLPTKSVLLAIAGV